MKKKMMAVLLAGTMLLAAGCGKAGKVTVGEYKGLALTSVSQETVEEELALILESYAELVEVDRAAEEGDTVNINFVGLKEGVAFEGGTDDSEEGTDLKLGSNSFIDGFEDGLIGAVAGEKRDLDLTFPEPYDKNPDLAGQAVVFQVTVNAVKTELIPKLTDDFVAENFPDYQTADAYMAALEEALNLNSYYEQVTEQVMASSEVQKYNEAEVAEQKQLLVEQRLSYASYYGSYYGLDTETALMYFLGYESQEALEEDMERYAYDVVKNSMIINEIAKIEKITVTDEKYDEMVAEYSANYGYEDTASFVNAYGGEETVREALLAELVMQFIIDNAVIEQSE